MRSLARIVDPPYTWRVPCSEMETMRGLLAMLRDLSAGNPSYTVIKESRKSSVYRLPSNEPRTEIYLKLYKRDGWRYLLRNPPGTREGRIMRRLRGVGVPVADFVAVGTKRVLPFEIENALIVRSPAGLITLGRWSYCRFQEQGAEARKQVSVLLAKVLAAVRRMHDAGVYHGDLNPGNVLTSPDGREFYFIDFHRSRRLWPQKRYHRTEDISELLEYFSTYYGPAEVEALIRAYTLDDGALLRAIQGLWEKTRVNRYKRRIKTVVNQCCDNRTFFRSMASGSTTLYMDRQYPPQIMEKFINGGALPSAWRCEEIEDDPGAGRLTWREAIRKSMIGEIFETPVAWVYRDPADGKSLLIWDTDKAPHYRLTHMFSLHRFDREGDRFLHKNRYMK